MRQKDADRMANSVEPDQTPSVAVWSGSTLFAQIYQSENLGSLRYVYSSDVKTINIFIYFHYYLF